MTTKTHKQYRAICPVCFNRQAVRDQRAMVQHGYTRPEGWHSNEGTCDGTNHAHFGTTDGRAYALDVANSIYNYADRQIDYAK
jgi:hypothetical protein